MIYLQLFWEFLKIGLFAVGGGMATLPFLQDLAEKTGWYSQSLITDMIAISESTPGPIGINMATYVGCNVAGFLGGVVATMGEILPAIVIVVTVSRYLEKFRGSKLVDRKTVDAAGRAVRKRTVTTSIIPSGTRSAFAV